MKKPVTTQSPPPQPVGTEAQIRAKTLEDARSKRGVRNDPPAENQIAHPQSHDLHEQREADQPREATITKR